MNNLHILSIVIEAAVTALGIRIGMFKGKTFGYFIALTFGIYVVYDMMRFINIPVSGDLLYILFFVASCSILYAVWLLDQSLKLKKR
jgi:hypothetical protein